MRTFSLVVVAVLVSACAHAQSAAPLPHTRVQIDARAETKVDNDRLRATLFAELEDGTGADAAASVNRAAADVLGQLRQSNGLDVRTGGYSTYPVTEAGRIVRWRARAELVVEGGDFALVSEAVGRAQASMQLARVEFFVSEAKRAAIESELTEAAVALFLAKAQRAARAFGGRDYHVAEAAIGSDGARPPQPMMTMRALGADEVAPAFEGGTTQVGVTVSGAILILR